MRKSGSTIEIIKNKIEELVGKNIYMEVCRGRKQIKKYNGIVESTFPSVFVVRLKDEEVVVSTVAQGISEGFDRLRVYSYSDVLCGEVVIRAE